MKKMFGFFASKKTSNKLFYAFVAVSSCLVILFTALAIKKVVVADASLHAVSKNLNTYDMNINYNDNYSFLATQTLHYTNRTGKELPNLMFNLYSTAFSEGAANKPVSAINVDNAYPNGKSYGKFEITSVKLNGNEANWKLNGIDKNVLQVDFDGSLPAGQKAQVFVEYNFTLPNSHHRYGYGEQALNVANFYPTLAVFEAGSFHTDPYHFNGDPFHTDASNYNVTLNVPKNFVVANTGQVVQSNVVGDNKNLTIEALAVRDFAFVMSENFVVLEDKLNDTAIKYYYYNDNEPASSLKAAKDSLHTFNELFGKYPYSTYSVVQTSFLHGGMEYPTLVMISDNIEKHDDYVNVIIHETAHQWWYQMVGSNAFRIPWLDEGLTEFSTAMFYERNPDYKVSMPEIIRNATSSYVSFVELCESVLGSFDSTMSRALNEYDTESEYVYITYVKGMLLFDNLRSVIGNKSFEKGLQIYFATNKHGVANVDDLVNAFERASLKSLTSFFSSWVDGKVIIQNGY